MTTEIPDPTNKRYARFKTPLLSVALLALAGAVGAQTYYTHELAEQYARTRAALVDAYGAPTAATPAPGATGMASTANPWATMQAQVAQMETQLDQAFQDAFGNPPPNATAPTADDAFGGQVAVKDAGKDYVVKTRLPGANKDDIQVQLQDRTLSIQAQTERTQTRSSNDGGTQSERSYASLVQRSLTLPGPVDAAGLQSHYADGVLTVTVPKAQS